MLYGQSLAVHSEEQIFGWEQGGPRSVRQGDWKLVWDGAGPPAQRRWRLFDLAQDRSEQIDLSATNPDKFAEMQRVWARYDQEVGVIY